MKRIRKLKNAPHNLSYDELSSPVGTLTIIASDSSLKSILWNSVRNDSHYEKIIANLSKNREHPIIQQTKRQLNEYFQGERKKFDLPLDLQGTQFQIQAWKQLAKIPYGKTISYAIQAERLGDKNKARAVGMANGANPISIIIPCHRVIGSDGRLTGFGGGLDVKAHLLDLERHHAEK